MRTLTAVTPVTADLPPDLGLLLAPVRIEEPSAPDEYVGRTEGVILDEKGRVLAFILRMAPWVVHGPAVRTLVSASAVTVTQGPILHVAWTRAQLVAQPRLDADLKEHNRVDGGAPVESNWIGPARPNVIPPSDGTNAAEAVKEGLKGGGAGAVLGALAGLALGGPIGALALGTFFAAGGVLAGGLAGATYETAVEAGEMKFDNVSPEQGEPATTPLRLLEERLRDPSVPAAGLIHAERFSPVTTTTEKAA